ncbi:MAG: hypothetical protein EOP88_11435 [Verrucomicrobiaceae bacterium]|nr:MAG: hypothetical protein EOP88_11435 [Verrucomicrobiaceae bacterium]
MKTSIKMTLVLAGLLFGLVGCQTQQKIALNQSAAHDWVKQQNAAARINVSGNWFAEGWGKASLKQSGRDVTGTIDTYEVKGVVSGNKAYLTTWDSGKCYYAIILTRPSANTLSGSYTDGPTYRTDAKEQRTVELRRSY